MEEAKIIDSILTEILTPEKHAAFKSFLKTDNGYNVFLEKLLRIIVGQDKSVSLREFLELHHIPALPSSFHYQKPQIMSEIAELAATGYTSDIIKWLIESKDEDFLSTRGFIEETRAAVKLTERGYIKKRLSNIGALNDFELTEFEINASVKIAERRRLKGRFAELAKMKYPASRRSKLKFKYSAIVFLIILGSIALAVTIPPVRKFIKQELHKLFGKENTPHEDVSSERPKQSAAIPVDTTKFRSMLTDPSQVDSTRRVKTKRTLLGRSKSKSIVTYKKYFNENWDLLEPAEGIWIVKEKNSRDYLAAIFKISENKYELRYFNNGGTWERADHSYYFIARPEAKAYSYTEYLQKTKIASGTLTFLSPTTFKCTYDYSKEFLGTVGLKPDAKAHFVLTGSKTTNESLK